MNGRDENRFRVLRRAAQFLRNNQEKLVAIAGNQGVLELEELIAHVERLLERYEWADREYEYHRTIVEQLRGRLMKQYFNLIDSVYRLRSPLDEPGAWPPLNKPDAAVGIGPFAVQCRAVAKSARTKEEQFLECGGEPRRSRGDGNALASHCTAQEKTTLLRRHLIAKVAVPTICDEAQLQPTPRRHIAAGGVILGAVGVGVGIHRAARGARRRP